MEHGEIGKIDSARGIYSLETKGIPWMVLFYPVLTTASAIFLE
jgi:hypothetical protein